MARKVKTDLFEGIMKAPEKKAAPQKAETKKVNPAKTTVKVPISKAAKEPASKAVDIPVQNDLTDEVNVVEATPIRNNPNNGAVTLDQFLKKVKAPTAASHTFYLKDTVFDKLTSSAKDKGTSPSKLLEALIEMYL